MQILRSEDPEFDEVCKRLVVHPLRVSGAEDRPFSGFVTEEEQFWELWSEGKFCYVIPAWEMDGDYGPIMEWLKEHRPEMFL